MCVCVCAIVVCLVDWSAVVLFIQLQYRTTMYISGIIHDARSVFII